jgi:hypothetical protein
MNQYYHWFTLTELAGGSPVPDGKKLNHEEHPETLKRRQTDEEV